jgi:hypothetical protein
VRESNDATRDGEAGGSLRALTEGCRRGQGDSGGKGCGRLEQLVRAAARRRHVRGRGRPRRRECLVLDHVAICGATVKIVPLQRLPSQKHAKATFANCRVVGLARNEVGVRGDEGLGELRAGEPRDGLRGAVAGEECVRP